MKQHPIRFGASRALQFAVCLCCTVGFASVQGDEPPVRLAPIAPRSSATGRIDPLRQDRLTEVEREELYEQVARDADYLERQAAQLRRLTQLLKPTVVHIDARKPLLRPKNGKASEEEAGSGVITEVAGRTVVITNRHVVHRSDLDAITIRLADGRELRPTRLWSDAGTDIGVMEIQGDDLEKARLGRRDSVQIGDTVIAIGSPFGLSHSVTLGIVSAKGRRDLDLGEGGVKYQDFIQTDAAINPGNSGGPLVNLRGEVIGLNTAIASNSGGSEGIGFAIPISMVMFVTDQLVRTGTVSRAYLGVTLDSVFTQESAHRLGLVRPVGARVSAVTKGSPADVAGIKPDDVIVAFDGASIEDDDHLVSLVSITSTDRTVTLGVFRNREMIDLSMPVASREQFE
jgi:serine protease Do